MIETLLFTAISDFQTLSKKLALPDIPKSSKEMDIYQLWFCAKNEDVFTPEHESVSIAKKLFPNIGTLGKAEQIDLGRKVLLQQKNLLGIGE